MNIRSIVIKHGQQRYDTVGDWWFENDKQNLEIRVSDLGDWRYNILVSIHEQVEALLCLQRNIREEDVTKFDIIYEARRREGDLEFQTEPGDHKYAPYRKEHFFATSVERLLAAELGVLWEEYDAAVEAL